MVKQLFMARIHVMGAAGSGTTTLAQALSSRLRVPHFDSDEYYWIPTVPPYRIKRDKAVQVIPRTVLKGTWMGLHGALKVGF